jgi:hypothetical protein
LAASGLGFSHRALGVFHRHGFGHHRRGELLVDAAPDALDFRLDRRRLVTLSSVASLNYFSLHF